MLLRYKQFVVRCESNPALYTRCTCLWFGEWKRPTMREIPQLLEGVRDLLQAASTLTGTGGDENKDDELEVTHLLQVLTLCNLLVHQSCRECVYVCALR
jgi:hypothetical protein